MCLGDMCTTVLGNSGSFDGQRTLRSRSPTTRPHRPVLGVTALGPMLSSCVLMWSWPTRVRGAPHRHGRPGPHVRSTSTSPDAKHVHRRRQNPCCGNHVRKTWVLSREIECLLNDNHQKGKMMIMIMKTSGSQIDSPVAEGKRKEGGGRKIRDLHRDT